MCVCKKEGVFGKDVYLLHTIFILLLLLFLIQLSSFDCFDVLSIAVEACKPNVPIGARKIWTKLPPCNLLMLSTTEKTGIIVNVNHVLQVALCSPF